MLIQEHVALGEITFNHQEHSIASQVTFIYIALYTI